MRSLKDHLCFTSTTDYFCVYILLNWTEGQRCLCGDSTGVENTASRSVRLRAKMNGIEKERIFWRLAWKGTRTSGKNSGFQQVSRHFKEEPRETERSASQDDDMITGAPSCLISQQTGRGKNDVYRRDILFSSVNRVETGPAEQNTSTQA